MAGKTATYYHTHPESYAKKKKKDAKDGKSRVRTTKRSEANQKRREAKKEGRDVRGKDYDHATDSFVDSSVNRGRKEEGGRKKKTPFKTIKKAVKRLKNTIKLLKKAK